MIVIDGSKGEGGGQIFRTSLTLAMCLGKSVQINNIRAGRSKPGLLRQHLTCLRAATEISGAQVSGGELGSREVVFKPGTVRAGKYQFSVGSAGSTSLVFQTVLMPLLMASGESEIILEGGTHNGSAPSFDFIQFGFLPVLEKMGFKVQVELQRFGFYPAGGGKWVAHISPAENTRALSFLERGQLLGQSAVATSSRLPGHVTVRELDYVKNKCQWDGSAVQQRLVDSHGPGNILSLRVESECLTEVIEVVGEKQLSAERVAGRAVKAMNEYLEAGVPVGGYLADQLLLPMALGQGGSFNTLSPSQHLLTNISVIKQFTGAQIEVVNENGPVWTVNVEKVIV